MNEKKTPRIRFKGFTDDWKQRKLETLSQRVIVGLATSVTQYYRDAGVPIFRNLNIKENRLDDEDILYLDEDYAKSQISKQIHTGDVLTVHTGYIGTSCVVPEKYDNCLTFTTLVTTTDTSKLKGEFLAQYLNSESGMSAVQTVTTQGGRQNLNTNDFVKVEIPYPSIPEQQKICEALRNLDNLITLHQRKYEKLQIIKKSMLENCFPKNGEKVPRIRFAGFTGDWEQRKLGEVVTIERGGSPRPIDAYITDAPDGLNWVKIGDAPEQGRYINHTKEKIKPSGLSKTRQVFPGDLILSNSMSFGKPYIMGIPGCIHDGWLLIRNSQNVFDLKSLCHMLGTDQMLTQYKSLAAGSTVNNLNKELVSNAVVSVPNKPEQERIGAFLESIDDVITLYQRKLEKLQKIKKSLLEGMFA